MHLSLQKNNNSKLLRSTNETLLIFYLILLLYRFAVDGNWGPWQPWSTCSASCGAGEKIRSRLCSNPPVSNNGRPCPGDGTQISRCNIQACPGTCAHLNLCLKCWREGEALYVMGNSQLIISATFHT